jgi:hypothetical protein
MTHGSYGIIVGFALIHETVGWDIGGNLTGKKSRGFGNRLSED